jgi:hypothetical protein
MKKEIIFKVGKTFLGCTRAIIKPEPINVGLCIIDVSSDVYHYVIKRDFELDNTFKPKFNIGLREIRNISRMDNRSLFLSNLNGQNNSIITKKGVCIVRKGLA